MILRRYSKGKSIVFVLCLALFLSIGLVLPGEIIHAYVYEGAAKRIEMDGVVYWYRDDMDDETGVQITAIQVPEGAKELILPETIDKRVVVCLHLREADGAKPLTGVTSLRLPSGMDYKGDNRNPTCVPPRADLSGNYLVPSLSYYFKSLERILVAEDNPYMTVHQGVLFNKDVSVMLFYPYGKKTQSIQSHRHRNMQGETMMAENI